LQMSKQMIGGGQGASLVLSLLSLEGVPNGELHVEVGVKEEKRLMNERMEEERWEGVMSVKHYFPWYEELTQANPAAAQQGRQGRDHTGNKQHAGRADERYVEQVSPLIKFIKAEERKAEGALTQRYQTAEHDLDLSYITHRLIATAIPRTDASDPSHSQTSLTQFLSKHHAGQCKVFTVQTKGEGEGEGVGDGVLVVNGDVMTLWQVMEWCAEVDEWLVDPHHAVVVQCDDGLHYSGWLHCAYLLFDAFCPDVNTAVKLFSSRRLLPHSPCPISSRQLTLLSYLHQSVRNQVGVGWRVLSRPLRLLHVRVRGVGEGVVMKVRGVGRRGLVWEGKREADGGQGGRDDGWTMDVGRVVSGDVCLGVWKKGGKGEEDECVMEVYWHTSFVQNEYHGWKGQEVEGRWQRGANNSTTSEQGEGHQHVQCEAFFAQVECE
jgi:hypothetical protein